MDVNMPEMDGHLATKIIRDMGYNKPIIGYTAYNHTSDVQACIDAGMDIVFNKPALPSVILSAVNEFTKL